MFSPQRSVTDDGGLLNPNRKRVRQTASRPSSRTQQRHERSESNTSAGRPQREGSQISHGRGSGSTASLEAPHIRRGSAAVSRKDLDGGVVDWTKNDKYRVSKLPALPPILKSCTANDTPVTAITDSKHGYALLLSHTSAYVWKYTSAHSLPHTYSFPLPRDEQYSNSTAPFPLGALVSPSASSNEPGLVVIMPMTGRTAYWDAIGSAVAEGLFNKRRGVDGTIPLMSGESVTSICPAEPAGFVISLSSGRLAHLALRDNAGRPGITVTNLRDHGPGVMGGLLGALRAGSSRRDVVAVRAGRVMGMGEREIIAATARGGFSRWHINRSGAYAIDADHDLRDEILKAVERTGSDLIQDRSRDQFMVLDMDVSTGAENSDGEETEFLQLLILGSYIPRPEQNTGVYVLVSVDLPKDDKPRVGYVHVIKSYTDTLGALKFRPRLYLPKPRRTAFIVFSGAVLIVSTMSQEDTQANGMDVEGQNVFEDVIDFRGGSGISIVGSGDEDVDNESQSHQEVVSSFNSHDGSSSQVRRSKNPAVVLVAKGAGVIRVEAFDVEGLRKRANTAPMTVKSKLEQAVFYGIKEDNPLNFQGRDEIRYPIEDVEAAALELSKEILGSRSAYLPPLLPSMEAHLGIRATHLHALVIHLKTGAFGVVSDRVMWQLLADAEKCEAARAVWEVANRRLRGSGDGRDGVLETVIVEHLPPEDADIAGNDPVRIWFKRDVERIGELLPLSKKSLGKATQGKIDHLALAFADVEANSIVGDALQAAYSFRASSATLYGLSGENGIDSNGLLVSSTGFPAPWTSETDILQALDDQYGVSRAILNAIWKPDQHEESRRLEVAAKIAEQLVELAEVACRAFEERADWCEKQAQISEDTLQEGITVRERYLASRGGWIKPLVEIGREDKAYEIAEKWQDYRTLVEICLGKLVETNALIQEAAIQQDTDRVEKLKIRNSDVEERLEGYFNRFGREFAHELYECLIETGRLQQLLDDYPAWREPYLTPFLRENSKHSKLAWINEVGLQEYERAANTLLTVARDLENSINNQRVELSIGKLAKLVASGQREKLVDTTLEYDYRLELIKIQKMLYDAVKPTISIALDIEAAVQLVTEENARSLRRKPALCELFKNALRSLIQQRALSAEELVDILTLMETEGGILGGREFYWALKAISLTALIRERRESAVRTVWRRCYLRDDWASITSTRNKSDAEVQEQALHSVLYTTLRLGYEKHLFGPESPFHPIAPEDSLFSESAREIADRFSNTDEHHLAEIGQELLAENRKLEGYIRKVGLGNWFVGLDAEARNSVRNVENLLAVEVEEDSIVIRDSGDGDVAMA